MLWYAVYNSVSGRLDSVGTRVAEALPPDVVAVELAEEPTAAMMWDEAARAFVPRPAKVLADRLQDILNHPDYGDDIQLLWNSLNSTQRTRLRNGLIKLLGRARWRNQATPITIEPE